MYFPQILQNKKVVIWPLFLKCVWLYGRGTEYFTKVMSGLPGGGWRCVRAVWNWFQQSSFPKSVTPDPTLWWAREKCYTHHPLWNRLFGLALTIRRFLPALIRRVYRGVREMVAGFAGPLKAQHKSLKCAVQVHAQGSLQRILATVFISWTISWTNWTSSKSNFPICQTCQWNCFRTDKSKIPPQVFAIVCDYLLCNSI